MARGGWEGSDSSRWACDRSKALRSCRAEGSWWLSELSISRESDSSWQITGNRLCLCIPPGTPRRLCRGNGGALLELSWSRSPESHHCSRSVTSHYRDPFTWRLCSVTSVSMWSVALWHCATWAAAITVSGTDGCWQRTMRRAKQQHTHTQHVCHTLSYSLGLQWVTCAFGAQEKCINSIANGAFRLFFFYLSAVEFSINLFNQKLR